MKTVIIVLGIAVLACSQATAETGPHVDYFTNNGYSNTISTMQHPAGEHYKGVTYVAYQGPLEDPYVAAYDHTNGKWLGPFKAGISEMGKTPGAEIDNHGKPTLVIDDEGYIHLFFGGHGGMPAHGTNEFGNTHRGRQIHVVSKRPQDISSWEVLDNVSPFGTYNQTVKMDNGDIYLFYRHGAHRSDWVYQKSTDNGRSFAPEVPVLKHIAHDGDPVIHDSWYAWFAKARGNLIIAQYNYHMCRRPEHNSERRNGYYMVLDTKDHVWRNANGEELAVPVTKSYADEMTLVIDTGNQWSLRGATRLDPAGNPHVTFKVGAPRPLKKGSPKQVNYFRWTGEEWIGGAPDAAMPTDAESDILITSPMDVSLLLDGGDEVAWWRSTDGGQSFAKGEALISRERTNFAISTFIRNAHPDARVVAAGNDKAANSLFRKLYLLGDQGPIKRAKAEADQIID
jgi:hypothetical protein